MPNPHHQTWCAAQDMGIARVGHHLVYGYRHGFLKGWPDLILDAIVAVWNTVSCRLLGHSHLIQDTPSSPVVCTACCRPVARYGEREVIRAWEE